MIVTQTVEPPLRSQSSAPPPSRSQSGVAADMRKKEDEIMAIIDVSRERAHILLKANHWRVDDAISASFEAPQEDPPSADTACLVCYGDDGDTTLSCGHRVCADCLASFLSSKLRPSDNSTPTAPPYTCTQLNGGECAGTLSTDELSSKCGDADRALLEQLIHQSNAATNDYVKCPAAGCALYAAPARPGAAIAVCECGTTFCALCRSADAHLPVTCVHAKHFAKLNEFMEAASAVAAATAAAPAPEAATSSLTALLGQDPAVDARPSEEQQQQAEQASRAAFAAKEDNDPLLRQRVLLGPRGIEEREGRPQALVRVGQPVVGGEW